MSMSMSRSFKSKENIHKIEVGPYHNPCWLKKSEMNQIDRVIRAEVFFAKMVLSQNDTELSSAFSVTLAYDFGNVLVLS